MRRGMLTLACDVLLVVVVSATFVLGAMLARDALPRHDALAEPAVRLTTAMGATSAVIGSGVVIGPRLVLTVAHVVPLDRVLVETSDHQAVTGSVLWRDRGTDTALVQLDHALRTRVASLSCDPVPPVGTRVLAIGNPEGMWFVHTWGRVAAAETVMATGVRTFLVDITIAPGSSGGPLLTLDGVVVGLADAILLESGSPLAIGLAVPSALACEQLAAHP